MFGDRVGAGWEGVGRWCEGDEVVGVWDCPGTVRKRLTVCHLSFSLSLPP